MGQEDDLIPRAAKGDWEALARLLGRHEGPLFGFFYRLGCHPNWVEDLVQEVMIRLYQARHRYDPSRPFSAWLYGIARNVWRDHARRRGREEGHVTALESPEEIPSTAADPLERSQQGEEAERVRRALQRLPEEERMTLILRHYQGLTYEEIAEALGVPLGTVKWRIHDAVRKMGAWLSVREGRMAKE